MFKVHVNDGATPLPDDDIFYIVAKEGIFLKKKMGIMESVAPVKNISILDSVSTTAKMNIKKIPGGQFAQVVAFFKEVCNKFHGEAIVLLFYDEIKKVYKIVPPHQKVTAGSCDYNKAITIEGMQMIGTIHSHARMSAFHSGVDDADEQHFDGLHVTIGNVDDNEVSISASIVANGHRFVVQPSDYIERLQLTKDIDEVEQRPTRRVYRWVNGKMEEVVEQTGKFTYSYRRLDKRYIVNVSSKYSRVNPEWMKMVERGVYTHQYSYGMGGMYSGSRWNGYQGWGGRWNGNNGWGSNYDSTLWNQTGNLPVRSVSSEIASKQSPLNVGVKVKPIEFPTHDIEILGENDNIPCTTCVFRSYKLIAEEEGSDEPDIYKCESCGKIIMDDNPDAIVLPICPTCNTDEYLNLIDESELECQYIKEDYSVLQKEPGLKENSKFITCRVCDSSFHIFAEETRCPFCFSELGDKPEEYSKEDELLSQATMDSGGYLSADTEEINRMALEEAQQSDLKVSPIPDPNDSSIPIPEQAQSKDSSLLGMFRSVFGKGKQK